jgi:hypothetical protein
MLNKIIFAIDNDTDVHAVAKFMRHIDTARAVGTLKGSFVPCIGCYDGVLESSYMMDERDYRKLVEPLGFTDKQECIMHVPADTRQPCTIEFDANSNAPLGPLRKITAQVALQSRAWTYVIKTDTYWTAEPVLNLSNVERYNKWVEAKDNVERHV